MPTTLVAGLPPNPDYFSDILLNLATLLLHGPYNSVTETLQSQFEVRGPVLLGPFIIGPSIVAWRLAREREHAAGVRQRARTNDSKKLQ